MQKQEDSAWFNLNLKLSRDQASGKIDFYSVDIWPEILKPKLT